MLDTNVLIGATFWVGVPHKLIRLAEEGRFLGLTSERILQEYRDTLADRQLLAKTYRKGLSALRNETDLRRMLSVIDVRTAIYDTLRDPNDHHLLACAIDGAATHIVTNDKAVLAIDGWRGIRIVTPEAFLKIC